MKNGMHCGYEDVHGALRVTPPTQSLPLAPSRAPSSPPQPRPTSTLPSGDEDPDLLPELRVAYPVPCALSPRAHFRKNLDKIFTRRGAILDRSGGRVEMGALTWRSKRVDIGTVPCASFPRVII